MPPKAKPIATIKIAVYGENGDGTREIKADFRPDIRNNVHLPDVYRNVRKLGLAFQANQEGPHKPWPTPEEAEKIRNRYRRETKRKAT